MNNYYDSIRFVKSKLNEYLTEIFKVYGNELQLKLEEYNLLTHIDNCIETSTATGFILEEFITSKLEIYSKDHNNIDEIQVKKLNGKSTINSSYDCYSFFNNIFFMINIKVQKEFTQNNAIAAINILNKDYVTTNERQLKSYIILKTNYNFGTSKNDGTRKIMVKGIEVYSLEEVDFSTGHKQDHRNWSSNFNAKSGRLQIPTSWRKQHSLKEDQISYEKTRSFISDIYNDDHFSN